MSELTGSDLLDALDAPHLAFVWLAAFDLPGLGWQYFHNGIGDFEHDGLTWAGVSRPNGGQVVTISSIEEPRFGAAPVVTIVLSGADRAFLRSVWTSRRSLEGRRADVLMAVIDQETERVILPPRTVFRRGRMSAVAFEMEGLSLRTITLSVEGLWSSKNFAPGGMWNPADQQRRYPGDRGLEMMGVTVQEQVV